MNKRNEMIAGASQVFEAGGFRGVGIDRVIAACGASTRTLYKHFGSRDGLVLAVLEARHGTFMRQLSDSEAPDADPVGSLFDTLNGWIEEHGARGCMLLRARSEYGQGNAEIVCLVDRQKREFREEIATRVTNALGHDDPALSTQIWVLFEGATAAASITGVPVIEYAKVAALSLVAAAKTGPS
ncbi:TetR/AcrR family transcriptional regulator [Halopseudomonas nanhaiensis]|uniref:TetR/AcrR family transcriptional regulator n=1 Tax=Halopseudomonas nanhaiensis TaxID=2830842 RepID=UPI001CBC1593|nr:TetR/AcrR family transcriptional regulator [Halopseudomonas nanhaiensis]UAW97204.1 TetR/AcrR family transcriptional regulator [Halopseudomonas nanhaiensis]